MLNAEEIRNYWEQRASSDQSAQSTTQDVYLRAIEMRVLNEQISRLSPGCVADVGCGDGRTTIRAARDFPATRFSGFDYSGAMIENARMNRDKLGIKNIEFGCHDIREPLPSSFDLIFTTRCLINLPDWNLQCIALRNIHDALNQGGYYLMIENFIEGHDNFNKIRRAFGLPEIAVRDHNLFFNRDDLLIELKGRFSIEKETNISSSYYLVSRIIYSRICADESVPPDYFDAHHRYGADLPFSGEFGPLRLLVLKRD